MIENLSRRNFLSRGGAALSAVSLSAHWPAIVPPAEQAHYARRSRPNPLVKPFFETVPVHTIVGFLIDPDSGGNSDGVGWKLIGRDREHTFQPPFGYYDKDYAGWQPNPPDPEKAKA